jgi:spore germination protein GerM
MNEHVYTNTQDSGIGRSETHRRGIHTQTCMHSYRQKGRQTSMHKLAHNRISKATVGGMDGHTTRRMPCDGIPHSSRGSKAMQQTHNPLCQWADRQACTHYRAHNRNSKTTAGDMDGHITRQMPCDGIPHSSRGSKAMQQAHNPVCQWADRQACTQHS